MPSSRQPRSLHRPQTARVYHTRSLNPRGVSDNPFDRAWDRWNAAYERGGLTKALTATRTRIQATQDNMKLLGILEVLTSVRNNCADRFDKALIDSLISDVRSKVDAYS